MKKKNEMTLTEYYKQIYLKREKAKSKLPKEEREKKRLEWNAYMKEWQRNRKLSKKK